MQCALCGIRERPPQDFGGIGRASGKPSFLSPGCLLYAVTQAPLWSVLSRGGGLLPTQTYMQAPMAHISGVERRSRQAVIEAFAMAMFYASLGLLTFRVHSGYIQGTIQGTFRVYSGYINNALSS